MRILVTGATGTLGRFVVPALVRAGHQVRALSRTKRENRDGVEWAWGDLASGDGVTEAVRGIRAVAHLATGGRKGRGPRGVDLAGTRTLLEAARSEGVAHVLFTSVVGADRVPVGFLKDKLQAEQLVRDGGPDWTILRLTPFHQWLDRLLREFSSLPVVPVDRSVAWQPVHARDAAERLVALVGDRPALRPVEFGGPEVLGTDELARDWLAARGLRRVIVPMRFPGRLAAAQRAGALSTTATPQGTTTWYDYLRPAPVPSDDFADEHTASPTSPSTQPEQDPNVHVYGGDEGYQRPTRG
ncbi:SDR family oxidoreductase [Nonomuraea pusilla]|uniref:Uncharacterized conserved protein YbjT, contains NAD(P)-binding and DUF2867 domains n=1 Tax=Nonomuraea pusilla TaxID=46177 RepID=A0A1H7KQS1_9ACTN|nr:NAD(P)H-binding protein [Nonomuraea pusilla]SEK88415.1 Uncharacterized conserved protein YbjT, contains NAD(P)-binding and DUF2867 domains [Nonomuraea pusilla]